MENIRVRFAPSPTGALHIGGIRTALYNYLLAKKHNGTFILRIEDTDQGRYVPGAEEYILEALRWCGSQPDEGVGYGGEFEPYRQSERKAIYEQYALELVEKGQAYYAFDTPEELDLAREQDKTFKYDAATRERMQNSLTLSAEEVQRRRDAGDSTVIRLKVPTGEAIQVNDLIRGEVTFQSDELDDKVMLKADGMPTYHLANIVDDHLMRITHVIRGEEWLPSTAHHVLLYRAFGWEDKMPQFAHLPLILKPDGKGKLSKRDGTRLGIPVFPLSWNGETAEESFVGFREFGILPQAMVNFMAFLGWNPGTEQEIFSTAELVEAFSIDRIGKSGARFDFEKAKWYNQQYIIAADVVTLAALVRPILQAKGHAPEQVYLERFCALWQERVVLLTDFWDKGYYFFEDVQNPDLANARKRWKPDSRARFDKLIAALSQDVEWQSPVIQQVVEQFMAEEQMKPGDVFPLLRIAVAGTTQGPGLFDMMALMGKEIVVQRLDKAFLLFDSL